MYVCINTTLVHLILFGWGLTLIEFEWGGRERRGWVGGGGAYSRLGADSRLGTYWNTVFHTIGELKSGNARLIALIQFDINNFDQNIPSLEKF